MPLNYDLREINQYKRLFKKAENGNSQMKSIPQTIILATMSVGMREITEDNYGKFYTRLHLLETVQALSSGKEREVECFRGTSPKMR